MAEWTRERFRAAVTWLPFDLHPEYPPEGIPRARLHERYGRALDEHVRSMFAANGLAYNPPVVVPRTLDALRLTELARDLGRHEATHDRLMDAYWRDGIDLGDHDALRGLAAELELPADDVERVLAGDDYGERVRVSTVQAAAIGINGIPAYLIDDRLLVLGAQPREVFERAFAQL